MLGLGSIGWEEGLKIFEGWVSENFCKSVHLVLRSQGFGVFLGLGCVLFWSLNLTVLGCECFGIGGF